MIPQGIQNGIFGSQTVSLSGCQPMTSCKFLNMVHSPTDVSVYVVHILTTPCIEICTKEFITSLISRASIAVSINVMFCSLHCDQSQAPPLFSAMTILTISTVIDLHFWH